MPPGVAFHQFDGVAKGVPVVEDLPQTGLFQVLGDYLCLDGDGPLDQFPDGLGVRVNNSRGVPLHQVQDGGIGDEAAFDDLGHSGNDFVPGQRVQGVQVGQDRRRRVERAHQVLALGGVDAGFSTHGGVHHAEQAGGHVDDLHPAQPGGSHKAGQVSHSAATDRDDGVGTGEIVLAKDLPAEGGNLDVLAFLRIRDFGCQGGETGLGQFVADRVAGEAQGARVDNEHAPDTLTQPPGKFAEQAPPHDDVVIVGGGFTGDFDHC
ncbi:hypothetical protein G205_08608 [Arthrobacter nitrophenolicus]|uniref:Uncharacterized protein n=1 Tax=Arthrobacter nitrophenolicus TaxID=683150 RepID=L8TSV7_9MICC|nr:hypothetical protein G205_08608 [Arthrobacter nitrophenolicus]